MVLRKPLFWRDHCKFSMVFEETITIECFLAVWPLPSMVFRWFFNFSTIAFNGFRWFRTIVRTMRWFRWIVVVYAQWSGSIWSVGLGDIDDIIRSNLWYSKIMIKVIRSNLWYSNYDVFQPTSIVSCFCQLSVRVRSNDFVKTDGSFVVPPTICDPRSAWQRLPVILWTRSHLPCQCPGSNVVCY